MLKHSSSKNILIGGNISSDKISETFWKTLIYLNQIKIINFFLKILNKGWVREKMSVSISEIENKNKFWRAVTSLQVN